MFDWTVLNISTYYCPSKALNMSFLQINCSSLFVYIDIYAQTSCDACPVIRRYRVNIGTVLTIICDRLRQQALI